LGFAHCIYWDSKRKIKAENRDVDAEPEGEPVNACEKAEPLLVIGKHSHNWWLVDDYGLDGVVLALSHFQSDGKSVHLGRLQQGGGLRTIVGLHDLEVFRLREVMDQLTAE
jgi:hypothetical protein